MMELREYLFRRRITITEFAKQINYDRAYVNKITIGLKKPGRKLAQAIEKATHGEVTARELLENSKVEK